MLINRLSTSHQHLGVQKGKIPWSHSILCLVTLVLWTERLNRWEQTKVTSRANHRCSLRTILKIFCFLYLALSASFWQRWLLGGEEIFVISARIKALVIVGSEITRSYQFPCSVWGNYSREVCHTTDTFLNKAGTQVSCLKRWNNAYTTCVNLA